MAEPIIALTDVSKAFGAVRALRDMSIALYPSEVHVLLGENGAGKSTLVNTLVGNYTPDSGTITLRGQTVSNYSPGAAREAGINVVFQDFGLAPTLSIADNLFLGREKKRFGLVNRKAELEAARIALASLGADLDPAAEVESLTRAEQQLVEIAKGIIGHPGALLLDEPTASISEAESERLFAIVDRLRADGWAILYITHRMEEMRRLGDRATVMRDGRFISTARIADVTDQALIADMVGRSLDSVYPSKSTGSGDAVLDLVGAVTDDGKVRGVSLTVRRGEIVGLAGLVGCGKGELAKSVLGLVKLKEGSVSIAGRPITHPSPRKMIDSAVGYMPDDRRRHALALELSVEDNIALEVFRTPQFATAGMIRLDKVNSLADRLIAELDIRPPRRAAEVGNLSGGNQQKVVLARALTRHREVYVVVEPTAGVDIGARQEIYATMRKLCENGAGVLLVSSDLEEVIGMSDRVYVMNQGLATAELSGADINSETIVAAAFGHDIHPTEDPKS